MKITCSKKKPQYFANMSNACSSDDEREHIRIEGSDDFEVSYEDWLYEHHPEVADDDYEYYDEYRAWLEECEGDVECSTNVAASTSDDLLADIRQAVSEFMVTMGFEFFEAASYSHVEIHQNSENGCSEVEVRAELDYDDMVELADILNPIVERYDDESYFEQVEPGIMVACVGSAVLGSFNDWRVKDYMLTPPEPDEPDILPTERVDVEVEVLGKIAVDEDGDFEWLEYDGEKVLRDPLYDQVIFKDYNDILDCVNDVILEDVPMDTGTYEVKGVVTLVFDISDVERVYETDLFFDNMEFHFIPDESHADIKLRRTGK